MYSRIFLPQPVFLFFSSFFVRNDKFWVNYVSIENHIFNVANNGWLQKTAQRDKENCFLSQSSSSLDFGYILVTMRHDLGSQVSWSVGCWRVHFAAILTDM